LRLDGLRAQWPDSFIHSVSWLMRRLRRTIKLCNWFVRALLAEAEGKPDDRAKFLQQALQALRRIMRRPIGRAGEIRSGEIGPRSMMPRSVTRTLPSWMNIVSCAIRLARQLMISLILARWVREGRTQTSNSGPT